MGHFLHPFGLHCPVCESANDVIFVVYWLGVPVAFAFEWSICLSLGSQSNEILVVFFSVYSLGLELFYDGYWDKFY